jgi:hypothetical protein
MFLTLNIFHIYGGVGERKIGFHVYENFATKLKRKA